MRYNITRIHKIVDHNLLQIYTDYYHPDGDMIQIYLEPTDNGKYNIFIDLFNIDANEGLLTEDFGIEEIFKQFETDQLNDIICNNQCIYSNDKCLYYYKSVGYCEIIDVVNNLIQCHKQIVIYLKNKITEK